MGSIPVGSTKLLNAVENKMFSTAFVYISMRVSYDTYPLYFGKAHILRLDPSR